MSSPPSTTPGPSATTSPECTKPLPDTYPIVFDTAPQECSKEEPSANITEGAICAMLAFVGFIAAFVYYRTEVKTDPHNNQVKTDPHNNQVRTDPHNNQVKEGTLPRTPKYFAFCVSFLVGCGFLALCIVLFLKIIGVREFDHYKTYPCFAGKASADDIQKGVYAVVRKEDGTASKSASCVCQDSCIDPVSKAGVPWKFGEKCPAAGGKPENEVNHNPRCKHI
jgi:hypothetical protein